MRACLARFSIDDDRLHFELVRYKRNSLNASSLDANLTVSEIRAKPGSSEINRKVAKAI